MDPERYDTSVAGSVCGAAPLNLPSSLEQQHVCPPAPCQELPSSQQQQCPPWTLPAVLSHLPHLHLRFDPYPRKYCQRWQMPHIAHLQESNKKTPSGHMFKLRNCDFKSKAQSPAIFVNNYACLYSLQRNIQYKQYLEKLSITLMCDMGN